MKNYLTVIPFLLFSFPSYACTGWAAMNDDGKVLIAKNRDAIPTEEYVEMRHPSEGFSYLGLFADGNTSETASEKELKAGVNDQGLVMISLSAKTVLGELEKTSQIKEQGVIAPILAHYHSVQEVYENRESIFSKTYPMFYMLADLKNIAYVEITPDHEISMTRQSSGILTHANQYLNPDFSKFNTINYKSSSLRYNRINELLKQHIKEEKENNKINFSMDDFKEYSIDTTNGPQDSIWRTAKEKDHERTVATFIVELQNGKSPIIYVKLAPSQGTVSEVQGKFTDF